MGNLSLQSYHLSSQHGLLHADALGHEFNGQDDFISWPGHWGGTGWNSMTVEAWINCSGSTGDFQAILSPKDTSFIHFQINAAGQGNIAIYTDRGWVGLPIIPEAPFNSWRHVAVVAKSGASKVFVDGVQLGKTNTDTFSYITATDDLMVGRGHAGGRHFKGHIAGLHLHGYAKEHEHIHGDIYHFLVDKPDMGVPPPPPVTKAGFKSAHGKYISAQPDGSIVCDRGALRAWEQFTIEDAGNGQVGLKSHHGKYISAQPDGSLMCDRPWLRAWEKFTMEEQSGKVGFKSFHGKYVSAQPDGSLVCDRDWLRGWELFSKES